MEQICKDIEDRQVISEISTRINQLEALSEADLKNEMANLKKALMDNPSACLLMLPEDIGTLVSYVRKLVEAAVSATSEKKPRATKAKTKYTEAELAEALNSEDF